LKYKSITLKYRKRFPQPKKIKWRETPSGRWVRDHHDTVTIIPEDKYLPSPHGPTQEKLTVKSLEGLDALKEKYAAEIEAGRKLQKRLD
jgi:hypothetical protein